MPEDTGDVGERFQPLLHAVGIGKSFVGNRVLDGVDLAVTSGEVHAIVGENGAGKSTLIKILGGIYQPDSGRLVVDGEPRRFRSPREALSAGVVVIHQELSLAPSFSAEENVFLGRFPRNAFGVVDRGQMRARASQVFDQLGITVAPQDIVGTLSIAQQQMVEIAKAISVDARILVLDEPTAVLDENRVEVLFTTINRLRAKGLGILFISHHLEEIFRIANKVTVLRDGRVAGSANVAEIDQDWLVARMIGRNFAPHEAHVRKVRQPALAIRNLSVRGEVSEITLTVGEGEIVGLAELVGAGRTELARAVVGLSPDVSGAIEVFGRPARIRSSEGRGSARDRLCDGGSKGARPASKSSCPRERVNRELASVRPLGDSPFGRRGSLCARHGEATGREACESKRRDTHIERRQPAEGADRPSPSHRAAYPPFGRTNSWRRYRREAGDLCADRASC